MTFIDASAPIAAHAAVKQNIHGVGANDIADVADISTHAAVTTNVHGTGAGNTIVGDNELSALAVIGSGCYNGNDTANRAIAHGLGVVPKLVLFNRGDNVGVWQNILRIGIYNHLHSAAGISYVVAEPDSTNFYIGNSTGYDNSGNGTGYNYNWVALG